MYMERGQRANALGMDSFDRTTEYENVNAWWDSVSPLTYTACAASDAGASMSAMTNAISSISLDGKQLTVRDTVAVAGIDKLKEETEKITAAIKKLGKVMGVDPFKNSKIDFEEYILCGDRLQRSELKTI